MKTTIALITLLLVASISVNAQYIRLRSGYIMRTPPSTVYINVVIVDPIEQARRDSIQKAKMDSINYNFNHNIIDGEYTRKAGRELLHMHSIRNEKEAACYNDSKAAFMCEEKYPYKGYPDVTKYKGYKEYKALKWNQ